MRNEDIIEMTGKIFRDCKDNYVHLPQENCDIPILDEPLIGFASACDPLFDELKKNPEAIGEGYMTPREWMEDSRSVLVFSPRSRKMYAAVWPNQRRSSRKPGNTVIRPAAP